MHACVQVVCKRVLYFAYTHVHFTFALNRLPVLRRASSLRVLFSLSSGSYIEGWVATSLCDFLKLSATRMFGERKFLLRGPRATFSAHKQGVTTVVCNTMVDNRGCDRKEGAPSRTVSFRRQSRLETAGKTASSNGAPQVPPCSSSSSECRQSVDPSVGRKCAGRRGRRCSSLHRKNAKWLSGCSSL